MVLVFVTKQTSRITYIFKHVFTNMLGLEIGFTSKIEDFIAHDGMKISYGKQALGNELFFQAVPLLSEQGFSDIEPEVEVWGSTVGFFRVKENSALPFDIFAAAFYMLSRYEEYAPHVKDEHGRFPATESIASKANFLESPIIDFWVERLKSLLKERYPGITLKVNHFVLQTIVGVEEAYRFKRKGIMRTVGGGFRDLFLFRLRSVIKRILVILFIRKDEYDIFDKLIDFMKRHRVGFKFMFQLSDFSAYDKNVSHQRKQFQSLIKSVADYAEVGLLLGKFSTQRKDLLLTEKKRMESIVNRPLKSILNIKYPMNLPETQNNIADLEIPNTFSMGYPETIGFRAGTCTPFLFYDINLERITPVKLHPYVANSLCIREENFNEISAELIEIGNTLKNLGGKMNLIFCNQDFVRAKASNAYLDLILRLNEA